jgi:diguanylate cyclase (GGDEF)-like protein
MRMATITEPAWDGLVAELPVGVLLLDERGRVLAANQRAGALLGLTDRELRDGAPPPGWRACDDSGAPLPDSAELADQVLRVRAPLTVPLVVAVHGVPRIRMWADYHPLRIAGQPRLLVLLQPVHTDIPHSRGLLDPLTGLPARALLLDRLEQALTRSRTHGTLTSLVLLDVHRLAAVNTEHGFHRGDELLTVLAGRLRAGMRADYTVARYGGGEFAVVAEHACGTGESVAAQARELAARPVRVGGIRLRPHLRVSWVTTDGATPAHAVVASAADRLRT